MESILSLLCSKATLEWAFSCIFGDGNYIHMMKANLKALRDTMQELTYKQEELEGRVSREEDKGLKQLADVQRWFSRVADIESEVNVLLEEVESPETGRLCLFGYCSNDCISNCEYGKKVSKKLEEVEELLSKGVFEEVAGVGPVPKVEKKHVQTTVGLDHMVEKAWNLMNGEHTKILGLYGMGGVGKTTILSGINNKFLEEVNEFDVVIWVVVSKDLQNEGIQNKILGRLRLDKEWEQETEENKACSIYEILSRKKKFVLLLDNIWSEVDLNKIGVPHPTCDNGAKIVFTTRSKEVCKDMKADDELKVECLSPNEAWELFQKIVGEVTLNGHEDIPKLAEKVVEKCRGLPLALNVIGQAMAYKKDVHKWRDAVTFLNSSSHEFPGMEEKIMSILKFSYDGLRDENVKSCFLYCSLFPEDYEIRKEELIELWICEGLINGNRDEDRSNNQGHAIIGSLVRAHLLMDVDGEFTREMVKMHDVVREMALWIGSNLGEGEKNWVKSGAHLHCISKDINWKVVRRISLMSNQIKEISCCPPECPNLSTLLLRNNDLRGISGEFFQFMSSLVVLDLSKNEYLCYLPDISNLTSLEYINLSATRIRSLHMKGLTKLISLDLEDTLSLRSIDGIGSLPNLQVLKLYHSGVCIDARLMEELQLLKHLTILTATVKNALILECIQGIKLLASCLQRLGIEYITELVVTLNAVALCGLQELTIYNSKISEVKINWERSPISPCFKHLSTVTISELKGPKDLTWLLLVPEIRYLTVMGSSSIEEIVNSEKEMSISNVHPDISLPFQKLEVLRLENLPGLKRICSNPPSLPKLRESLVEDCPNLPKAATEFTSASLWCLGGLPKCH